MIDRKTGAVGKSVYFVGENPGLLGESSIELVLIRDLY